MIPADFDAAFLDWFQAQTEAAWARYRPYTFQDYVSSRVGGVDWQRGTRWLGGLEDEEIRRIEERWRLAFPADYRRFLSRLHTVDRPMVGAGFAKTRTSGQVRSSLVPTERPSFYNWLLDDAALQHAWDWLVEGLQFDVEHNDLWMPSWGPKTASIAARQARVQELVAAAPRLIPVFGHRFLLAEPNVEGNPVFSIYQSDVIVFAVDLRSYLLLECADLLNLDSEALRQDSHAAINARYESYCSIPFWGELLDS